MPRLHAKHRTEIRYAGVVGESVNEIRLSPSDNGRQQVEWAHVRIVPAAELFGHRDVYGNDVRWFQLVDPHESLVVESEAVVVTRPAAAPPTSVWGTGFAAVADPGYLDTMAEFLAGSPHVRWTRPIGDFADALRHRSRGGRAGLGARPGGRHQLNHRLHAAARPRWTRPWRRWSPLGAGCARTWRT